MSWLKKYCDQKAQMSVTEALAILGISIPEVANKSADEVQSIVKRQVRLLAQKWHPDKSKPETLNMFNKKMTDINNAKDTIMLSGWKISRPDLFIPGTNRSRSVKEEAQSTYKSTPYSWESEYEFIERKNREKEESWPPLWETDRYARNFRTGKDRRDVNFCKKEIYDYSINNGDVRDFTFISFDGAFFRGMFTVKTNPRSFNFVTEVMDDWVTRGANPYNTEAIFLIKVKERRTHMESSLQLLWLKGQIVNEHVEFEGNLNDSSLLRRIREYVQSNSVN